MGCFCSKGIEGDLPVQGRRRKSSKRLVAASEKEDTVVRDVDGRLGDGWRERLIPEPEEKAATALNKSKKAAIHERSISHVRWAEQADLVPVGDDAGDKQQKQQKQQQQHIIVISSMPNGALAEHIAAGWPLWLTKVAGEAVRGWLPRKIDSFADMEKIGQGTYSNVYKANDLITSKIVALKKVRFANLDPESVQFMAREIYILRKLNHPNVIKLEGLVASKTSNSLWLVFQYMEHDLAGLAARRGIKLTISQVKCIMQQLFNGLNYCHNNGVMHRDIKGANLLINNDGILKIADFGLATFYGNESRYPLTSRVVTLWYRPPELLLGAQDYGASVDLWSSGCILAELLFGKPIMPGRTEVEQLHMIFKLCGSPSEEYWGKAKLPHATIFKPQHPYKSNISEEFREFPAPAVALLQRLLAVDPADRGTSSSALTSEFFTVEPMACDPSGLPKCPPSKELDVKKLRDAEAAKQREATKNGNDQESGRKFLKDSKANAKLQFLEKSRSSIVMYNLREDTVKTAKNGFAHPAAYDVPARKKAKEDSPHALPAFSSSSFSRSNSRVSRTQRSYSTNGSRVRLPGLLGTTETQESDHRVGYDRSYHLLEAPNYRRSSSRKSDERGRESTTAFAPKRNRIMHSGPLMPAAENINEMLKEHEKQIHQAVRKACLNRTKDGSHGLKAQTETLVLGGRI